MNDEDYERQAAWKRRVLAAMGVADADEVRESFGVPATPGHAHAARVAQQARLHTGRWATAGRMEVRLS